MTTQHTARPNSRFLVASLSATVLAVVACLSTHLVVLLGLAGMVAWLGQLEHALLFASVGFGALTLFAAYRHRKGGKCHD